MRMLKQSDFEEQLLLPLCTADITEILKSSTLTGEDREALLSKCRVCARRYTSRGWLSDDSSCGIWEGCAHLCRFQAAIVD